MNAEVESHYRREQQLMLSAWHEQGMRIMRAGVGSEKGGGGGGGSSWLAQQRSRSGGRGLVSSFSFFPAWVR